MFENRSLRGLLAAGALAGVVSAGLAFAPALRADDPAAQLITAADLGLDYAPRLVHVDAPTVALRNAVAALGLDMTEHASNDHVEVILTSAAEEALLRDAGFTWEVEIADMVLYESQRIAADRAFAEAVVVSDLPSGRTGYRMLEDFGAEIDELVAAHGDIAKKVSIGESLEGRDLTGIEIGARVNEPEDGRPVFLMFGVHHAREWPSAEMPMEFAIDLVQSYAAGDERIVDLLERSRVIIVPVSNPDGYNASRVTSEELGELPNIDDPLFGGAAILTPTNAYKRKNCRVVEATTQPQGVCELLFSPTGAGIGVDLNRNYGGLWGGPGASDDPSSATYRGTAPFSEPETQAIRSLISTRQVTTLITNHTQGHLLLRPVGVAPSTVGPDGYAAGFAPDECFTTTDGSDYGMQSLGERMTAQNGYSNQFGWELYDTTGTTEDYSYNATGGYGYTFELMDGGFHQAYEDVVAEYTGTTPAAKAVTIDNAPALTTGTADDCAGTSVQHTTVGGGMREAYLIALENVVDTRTHSVITGQAPQGAVLTVQRDGVFPLWDGTEFADSVVTSMVAPGGDFAWHVNPSTRPFVASRRAPILSEPIESYSEINATPANLALTSQANQLVLEKDADTLVANVSALVGVSTALSFNEFRLFLDDANGNTVATAEAFGSTNTLKWDGPDGAGVPAGTYTLRVTNGVNPTAAYQLTANTYDVIGDATPGATEQWTLRCAVDGTVAEQRVTVGRGEQVDVGAVCAA